MSSGGGVGSSAGGWSSVASMVAVGISEVSTGGGSLWKASATAIPCTSKAPPKAESTCHFGAGLNKSGPGPLSFIGYLWLPCAGRRHSRPCLAFDFKCDFVKTLRAQDIEYADDIAVHGVTIPPHEHLRVRVFLMNFSQYGGLVFVRDRLLVEGWGALFLARDTNVIAPCFCLAWGSRGGKPLCPPPLRLAQSLP